MKLKPYQEDLLDFVLDRPRCFVRGDPGIGKTAAILHAISALLLTGEIAKPVLIIAPLRVARDVWPSEISKWPTLHGLACAHVYSTYDINKLDILTVHYDILHKFLLDHQIAFDMVVADESTRLKNFRIHKCPIRLKYTKMLALGAKRWVNLTGTPAPNGVGDLWGQMWFVDQGQRLGSYRRFKELYFNQGYMHYDLTPKPSAEADVAKSMSDVCLVIEAKKVLNLDDPVINTVLVDLSESETKEYATLEKDLILKTQDLEVVAPNAAVLTIKCHQYANGAIYESTILGPAITHKRVHNRKLVALAELIDELDGANVLVAYHFKIDRLAILEYFNRSKDIKDISTSEDIDNWNGGSIKIGLINPASVGHGLNLQHGGHHLILFSLTWNLENYLQCVERIGPARQKQSGYTRPVFIYHIVTRGTIDEAILLRLQSKTDTQTALTRYLRGDFLAHIPD